MSMAYISRELKKGYFPIKTGEKAIEKYKMMKFLKRENILLPKSRLITENKNDSIRTKKHIIKPSYSKGGKKGVYLCQGMEESKIIEQMIQRETNEEKEREQIVEEFIEGKDITLHGICIKGKYTAYTCIRELHISNNSKLKTIGAYSMPKKERKKG